MFYTEYAPKWEKAVQSTRILDTELKVKEYDNALLLPLRKRADTPGTAPDGWHEGGVCSENYEFLAGLQRKYSAEETNYSCKKSYIPESTVYRDETVIFGGILMSHFGHGIMDSLSRMWYYAKHPDTQYKLVFLMMTNQHAYNATILQLAGLSEDRYEIITEPTMFKKVIIPDEAIYTISGVAHKDWLLFFDLIKEDIRKRKPKSEIGKVYLTRTQLPNDKKFEINEIFYENFFAAQGYSVIAPEKYPLEDQINLIMNATDVVTTVGTLSHMLLFGSSNMNCTFLMREPSQPIKAQLIIDSLKGYSCKYVEATEAPLPTTHANGVPFYVPTKYFEQYISENGMDYAYKEQDKQYDDTMFKEYLCKYALNYRNPHNFKWIKDYTAYDYISSLNRTFFGVNLDRKNYQKSKMELENEQLKKEIKRLKEVEKELHQLKNSASWKITKPLRWLSKKFRVLKKKVKACFKH